MELAITLPKLLEAVADQGQTVTENVNNEKAQAALLIAARDLVSALESPVERLSRMVYLEPTLLSIVRASIDWNLYPAMTASGGSPKTAIELAQKCKVDAKLMSRSLKHLAAGAVIKEVDVDTYVPTPFTNLLCDAGAQGMVIDMCVLPQIVSHFSDFIKERGGQNPIDKDDSPFMHAYNIKLHYFEWLNQPGMETRQKAFGKHMSFKDMGKKWFQMTDVPEILGYPKDPEAVLMVDVGGSHGHDIIGFHKAYPKLPGRLILQDLPVQIDKIDHTTFPEEIEATGYDFFTPEPIQGAKAYYLHMVLHDWPDSECIKILANITPAMKRSHSKILLNEIVIPDRDANWFCTSVDILMMMVHAAQERTESEWRKLLEASGLRLTKIWDCEGSPQKVIEAELA